MSSIRSGMYSGKFAMKACLMLCVPMAAYSGTAYSQEQDGKAEEAYRINTISVYGQSLSDDSETTVPKELWVGGKVATSVLDTPALVSVITEKEMAQRDVSTTEDILQYTPGTVTGYYGSDDRNDYFMIRGYQATTYRDGMTLGSMRGVREDPYAFERVEVIRGANSTLFGPADPGGSVNFVSKRPKFKRFGSSFIRYGSFDQKEAGLDFGDTLNDAGTVAYRLTTKIKDGKREYHHSKNDSQLIMGGLSWQPDLDTTATLIVDYLGQDATPNSGGYPLDKEYSRSQFFGEPDYNDHDVDRLNITGQFSHYFENGIKLSANLRYSHLHDDFGYVYINDSADRVGNIVSRDYFGTDTSSRQWIGNIIAQYDVSFEHIDSSTLVGLEYRDASTDDESVYTVGGGGDIDVTDPQYQGRPDLAAPYSKNNQDYTTKSVFLQQNLSFYDCYILTFGIRHDYLDLDNRDINDLHTDSDFSETSLRAAFTYKVTDEWSTYLSQVESIAPPKTTSGTRPERGEQLELGVKFAPRDLNALFSAAIYDLKKKDVAMAVVQGDDINTVTMGKTRVRGLDLEVKAEVTDHFNITGGYSYMRSKVLKNGVNNYDGTVTSYRGNEFATTPRHSASLWGYYTFLNQQMDVGLGARYIGSYYFDAANSEKSASATLFDATFSYQLTKAAKFTVNAHNLLNKQYLVGTGTANWYNSERSVNAALQYNW